MKHELKKKKTSPRPAKRKPKKARRSKSGLARIEPKRVSVQAPPSLPGTPPDLPPLEFFLPFDDRIDGRQQATLFGPQVDLEKGNFGSRLRSAMGIRDDTEQNEGSQLLFSLRYQAEMIAHALDAGIEGEKEGTLRAASVALWGLVNRMDGLAAIHTYILEAAELARDFHSEATIKRDRENEERRRNDPKWDALLGRTLGAIAVKNARMKMSEADERRAKDQAPEGPVTQ